MALDSKLLEEILDNTEEFFLCLKCGECCYRWSVSFDSGYIKGENEKCPYLDDIGFNEDKFTEASCRIYLNRPQQCKNFKISFATLCPIGLWKWSKIKNTQGESKLPMRIKKIFDFLRREK